MKQDQTSGFPGSNEHPNDQPYTILEGMTSLSALLSAKTTGINDRQISQVLFDRDKKAKKLREFRFLEAKSKEYGFSVTETEGSVIDSLTSGATHGGIIALCGDRTIPALTKEFLRPDGFYVMLEGIEDPYNFGYALRSLYAAGVDGIILSPRNWMTAAGTVARASAGASELFDMAVAAPGEACDLFRSAGYTVLCAGIRDSVSVFDETFKKPVFLIVGGEKRGISAAVLVKADKIVRIDYGTNYRGNSFRGSLSAASAASVLAFEILRQNR